MASFGTHQFFGQWFTGPFGLYAFFFYESIIGLSSGIIAIAFILYATWNAINDPLWGYLLHHIKLPWDKRIGRRFPWIIIGAIPFLFSYLMIFMVPLNLSPPNDQWIIFLWLIISIFLFDTTFTIWNVSVTSMYPDKFPSTRERRTASGFGTLIGMAGIVTAYIFAPLFLPENPSPTDFQVQAWALIGVGFLIFALMLPGVYENKKTRQRAIIERESEGDRESFISTAKTVLKNKRFMTKVIFFFGYQTAVALLSASANYMVIYVLGLGASDLSIVMAGMLLGAIVSVPLWNIFGQKIANNRKMGIIAGFLMVITFLPMMFVTTFFGLLISIIFFGIALGGQWFINPPLMGDVLDDVTVRTGKKQHSVFFGYQTFFIRFGIAVQAITFAVVHSLTGFIEGAGTYQELAALSPSLELALFGIRLHTSLIPALIVLACTLIFWKYYDLTNEKVLENKKKLEEMNE
jgi:GPH family glycoside/pentoside/hexuronide:cation symporter